MAGISGPRIGRSLAAHHAPGDRDFKWRTLDARGYMGSVPRFPLPEIRERETELWGELWRTPQAIEWHRLQLERQVALYVRKSVDTEMPGAKAADMLTLRQMTDALGLSIPGMRAHRWRISEDEAVDEIDEPATPTLSARERAQGT